MPSSVQQARRAARDLWSRTPAGTSYVDLEPGTAAFFEAMTADRYSRQPWHPALLEGFAADGRVLEIGCGAGTDHAELARTASETVALDLALTGASLTRRRGLIEGRPGHAVVGDGEQLPFRDESFDTIYSFGVVHHTDHPERVAAEMYRVLRPGGRFLVALYHRYSMFVGVQVAVFLAKGRFLREPWSALLDEVEAGAGDSDAPPKIQLYSSRQARRLFERFESVETSIVHGDTGGRLVRSEFLESRFGWYVVVQGRKPGRRSDPLGPQ